MRFWQQRVIISWVCHKIKLSDKELAEEWLQWHRSTCERFLRKCKFPCMTKTTRVLYKICSFHFNKLWESLQQRIWDSLSGSLKESIRNTTLVPAAEPKRGLRITRSLPGTWKRRNDSFSTYGRTHTPSFVGIILRISYHTKKTFMLIPKVEWLLDIHATIMPGGELGRCGW